MHVTYGSASMRSATTNTSDHDEGEHRRDLRCELDSGGAMGQARQETLGKQSQQSKVDQTRYILLCSFTNWVDWLAHPADGLTELMRRMKEELNKDATF
jgi:hypothetical protein